MIKIRLSFILFLGLTLFSGFIKECSLLFLAILIHEIGHIITLKLFKQRIEYIEMTGIGFFIKTKLLNISSFKKILIYSSGIIFNLISILLLQDDIFQKISFFMICINLIPVIPLDGFQIINVLLGLLYEDEYINDVLFYIGMLLITILLIFSLIFNVHILIILLIYLLINLCKYHKSQSFLYLKKYIKLSI